MITSIGVWASLYPLKALRTKTEVLQRNRNSTSRLHYGNLAWVYSLLSCPTGFRFNYGLKAVTLNSRFWAYQISGFQTYQPPQSCEPIIYNLSFLPSMGVCVHVCVSLCVWVCACVCVCVCILLSLFLWKTLTEYHYLFA